MASLYLHIPFCKQACYYCNFHFSTGKKNMDQMIASLKKEMKLNQNYLGGEKIETLYFGGGTPSILHASDIEQLIDFVKNNFELNDNVEVTLEANPDDITEVNANAWLSTGVNRLSIGTQSFLDKDLKWMNRAHNAEQAIKSIKMVQQCGFNNINIDLIYGLPESTNDEWKKNLEQAIELQVQHLSCYSLTVEPRTALDYFVRSGNVKPVDEEKAALQFEWLMKVATENNFEHYEISNFAIAGMRSRHNSSYWLGKKYLGIGPSAHSYNGISRQWNAADNNFYISALLQNEIPYEIEILSPEEKFNEFVMIRLRTIEGISKTDLQNFETSFQEHFSEVAKSFIENGLIQISGNNFSLTNKGKLLADHIISELMIVKD